ncbi:MAG TPA: hypothetical protein VES39_06740 [Rhodospirillales bacterium]|nr:hypothetical protein [Rhodospirillales bacterium]
MSFRRHRREALLCLALLAPLSGVRAADEPPPPGVADSPQARAAAAAMREARERRLLDEQRAVEGRIRTLDRQLQPWERERRSPATTEPRGDPRGVPAPLQDPVAERLDLERRGLRDQERLLEDRIRNERFDRERTRRMRQW